ncbi:unnamed protein product [Effrenium voratum]|uniref:HTH La-type RNA-binding domain-containing protein n=1 Tax=Effrenium voratum TaxID=2562239 RepID=A0AA36I8S5_9DINO|nr:unnamed protein product [Effrenium voratum]
MNYMPPMAQAMPFDVAQLPMYPPYMGGGMGMPFIGYMPEMMPGMSSQPQRQEVVSKAQRQIDYYFSKENLIKDVYLRRHIMDTQGWVSLTSLAQFPKLAHITSDLGMLVEAVGNIQKLEMKQDASAVRLREDWQGWVLQPGT